VTADRPRGCIVCGSTSRQVLFHQDFSAIEQATPLSGYDVAVCTDCGCAYADGIPDQGAFDQYYRDMSRYEYHQREGAESEFDQRRLKTIAELIEPHVPRRDARILDIGCASGRLLANLRERGFANVLGLDPSAACAAAARRLYAVDVLTMTLAELARTDETFDFIILVGVLEHLCDIDRSFAELRTILRPGGLAYVEVPDATTFVAWDNAPFQDFSTEHINFFGPVSLQNLMEARGFSRVFLEQNHREQSWNTVMSNISAVFRKSERPPGWAPTFDHHTTVGLQRYIARCEAEDRKLRERIDAITDSKQPILVWGVGTHTARLMATSRLAEANIVAFIESNARYQGKTMRGRPILAPEVVKSRNEAVLVSSRVFQREIASQLRDELSCKNELILLYDM
jgi:SAM-dependent methyltransferase